jgi:hypothetical protein
MAPFLRFVGCPGVGLFRWHLGFWQMPVPERAGSRYSSFQGVHVLQMIENVNRRRRILTIVACGLVALLLTLMFSSRRRNTVPLSAIGGLHDALIRDGFKLDQKVISIDEIAVPSQWRSVVAAFYPGYRKQTVNRSYSKDEAKLGIDYIERGEEALNVSLPADVPHCARARRMARELSALNPNLTIWLRTNQPPIVTKR